MNSIFPFSISFLYPAFLGLLGLGLLFLALGWPERQAPNRRQQWLGLGLRTLILVALVLGLAGAQLERPIDRLTTVFVLDVSDSVTPADRAQAEAFLRQALAEMPSGDQAAVVLFGGDALVERLPRSDKTMPLLNSIPVKQATNIENALRLSLALLPNEGGSRIVLLSDGQETAGEAVRLAELAEARQVEISVYPLGAASSGEAAPPEILVEQVSAPGQARQGQVVSIEAVVLASQPAEANLRLLAEGRLVETQAVRLNRGRNRYRFDLPLVEAGFHRFRVEVEPVVAEADGRLQNNWGAAFTNVFGPPQLLVVEGTPGEGANLLSALEAAGLQATLISPATLPDTLPGLTSYDAIILANVPAEDLPQPAQETLTSFVRDLGRGLVMVGGPESYGAGGYLRSPLEKALPVNMEVRNRSREPNIALVLAVDKSGSMGACHCDNPDLRQQYTRVSSGLPKIEIAKEAILQASAVLGELDYLGVVSFDVSAHWELDVGQGVSATALEGEIGGIIANGQTNIFAGLSAAEAGLVNTPARVKHVILLTDGWSTAGAYDELIDRFAEEGITLSVVAAGGGSAEYLQDLALKGGGQYYPAATMSDVPQIFLKETVRAVGDYIIEGPFLPVQTVTGPSGRSASPILGGLDLGTAPPLLGYNGTTPKSVARVALLTPRGDPLLATWQYGLGRSVAWTSDLSGRWAKEWLSWADYVRFVGQLVSWSLPAPGDEKLAVRVTTKENEVVLTTDLTTQAETGVETVMARLLPAEGEAIVEDLGSEGRRSDREVELLPVGAGRYQAAVSLPAEGVYLAQVTAFGSSLSSSPGGIDGEQSETEGRLPLASQTTGLVVPYSAEYATLESDLSLLHELAMTTGGGTLTDPAEVFVHNLAVGRRTHPIWPPLLLLAALLFPIDVAVRRLRLGRQEWQQVRTWLAQRIPGLSSTTAEEQLVVDSSPTLRAFRQVRQRGRGASLRQPSAGPEVGDPTSEAKIPRRADRVALTPASEPQPSSETPSARPQPSSDPARDDGDTLSRLRAAKRRARQ
jgi:uncharacterized membrane protein